MITGQTVLETAYGSFRVAAHGEADTVERCLSVSMGDLSLRGTVVRLHSSCLFGEALLAQDCDCGPQLSSALADIARRGRGVVIYLYQEGRGAGIDWKIQAMERQRVDGIDSYAAYDALELPRDQRQYELAGVALGDLGVSRDITAITNNPSKRVGLGDLGYNVIEQLVVPYTVSKRALNYLEMKKHQGQHAVDFSRISFEN